MKLAKLREVKKLDPRLDPLYVKSLDKRFILKRMRNGRVMVCNGINPIKVTNPKSGSLI